MRAEWGGEDDDVVCLEFEVDNIAVFFLKLHLTEPITFLQRLPGGAKPSDAFRKREEATTSQEERNTLQV
jgi:hypothetical protein